MSLEIFEEGLVKWIQERKTEHLTLSDELIIEKAKNIHTDLHMSGSGEYSESWLLKFKKRHGIKYTREESVSAPNNVNNETLPSDDTPSPVKTRSSETKNKSSWKSLKKKRKVKKTTYKESDSDEEPLIFIKQEREEFGDKINGTTKRKHVQLTITEKVEILRKIAEGMTDAELSTEYNIGRATLFDIKKKKNILINYFKKKKKANCLGNKKTVRCAKWPELEAEVFKWYVEERTNGNKVIDIQIIEKARQIHVEQGLPDEFMQSYTWLRNFKIRHRLKHLDTVTEGFTVNLEEINKTIEENGNDEAFVNEIELDPLLIAQTPLPRGRRRQVLKRAAKPLMRVKQKPIVVRSCLDQELKPIVMQLNNYIYCQSENDIFGKYVTTQLDNMTPINKANAQERIQAILTHYKLQAINRPDDETETTTI